MARVETSGGVETEGGGEKPLNFSTFLGFLFFGALENMKKNGAPQARHRENTKEKGKNGAPQARQERK